MIKSRYGLSLHFKILCFLLSGILLPLPLFANDTLVGESGRTVLPINTEKIRMVSEHIKVVMKQDPKVPYLRWAHVTCAFVLENASNEKIKAIIGFPSSEYSESQGPYLEPPLKDFRSYVDGIKQTVEIKKELLKQWEEEVFTKGRWEKSQFEIYRYWYKWGITFPPFRKVTVKNTYSTNLSTDGTNHWFEYILTTGANWKGNLEEASIEILYPNKRDLKNRVIEIKPAGYKIDKNRIYWEFRNFKPTENIKITEKWIEKEEFSKNNQDR